jgi:hypothetical protein
MPRACEVRAGDDQFAATNFLCSRDHCVEVVRMSLRAMIFASEDGIGKIDSNLPWVRLLT